MTHSVNKSICSSLKIWAGACLLVLGTSHVHAQAFTHADSGWVPLWNGKDWNDKDIYSRTYGATAQMVYPPASTWQILYPGTDTAAIYVSSISENKGNIGTKKTSFSHYRMHVEGKFDVLGENASGGDNAGITYHTDETVKRMNDSWPRSIEFQMRQVETGSAFSIQQVTSDSKAQGGSYNPNGTAVTICQYGCNARSYKGSPLISNGSNGKTRWLRYELVARGADSVIHIVNDTVVFKHSNIRIFNDATQSTSNKTPNGPHDHGGLCLQSEGALVKYRRWEIMEFPAATPKGENYLHRFFLTNFAKDANVKAGSTQAITWRTLGTVGTVSLDYSIGTGAWQSIAKDVANTGTHSWLVPATNTNQLKIRISGPAWAAADSSSGYNTIGDGVNISDTRQLAKPVSFSIAGKGMIIPEIQANSQIEICNVFGRSVKKISVQEVNLSWDGRNANGDKVQSGIYFIRMLGDGVAKTVRTFMD
jgi:hypothetical protein